MKALDSASAQIVSRWRAYNHDPPSSEKLEQDFRMSRITTVPDRPGDGGDAAGPAVQRPMSAAGSASSTNMIGMSETIG